MESQSIATQFFLRNVDCGLRIADWKSVPPQALQFKSAIRNPQSIDHLVQWILDNPLGACRF
jgi:hypothetical protein